MGGYGGWMGKITAQESETWPDRKRNGIGLVIYRLICPVTDVNNGSDLEWKARMLSNTLDAWCSTARASKMPLP